MGRLCDSMSGSCKKGGHLQYRDEGCMSVGRWTRILDRFLFIWTPF